jgi:hypothetical protein
MALRDKSQVENLRSVLMQSGHLWTSGPESPEGVIALLGLGGAGGDAEGDTFQDNSLKRLFVISITARDA